MHQDKTDCLSKPKLSVIDRQLDLLCENIAMLETAIDRLAQVTAPARNDMPRPTGPMCDTERCPMSPVANRIASSNERIADLTAALERLTSEIEL